MDICRSYKPCNATPANELGAHRSTDCADVHLTSSGQVTYLANASILVVNDQVVIGILIILYSFFVYKTEHPRLCTHGHCYVHKHCMHTTFLFSAQDTQCTRLLLPSDSPLTQVQASFSVQCRAKSSSVTSSMVPPLPAMSLVERVNRIQSSSPQPGPRFTRREVWFLLAVSS